MMLSVLETYWHATDVEKKVCVTASQDGITENRMKQTSWGAKATVYKGSLGLEKIPYL